jgi:hypothetical protein
LDCIGLTSPIAKLFKELEAVNEGLNKAFNQRESHHHEAIARALTEEQRRCHQAFKTSTYEGHKNINPNQVEGTCEWALKNSQY